MEISQTYETTLVSDSDHTFQALVIPRSEWPTSSTPTYRALQHRFALDSYKTVQAGKLAKVLAKLLSARGPKEDNRRFAEFVSFERIIPIEPPLFVDQHIVSGNRSTITKESLATLVSTAIERRGELVLPSSTRSNEQVDGFLLVCASAAVVICGTTRALGNALDSEGHQLRERIAEWISVRSLRS